MSRISGAHPIDAPGTDERLAVIDGVAGYRDPDFTAEVDTHSGGDLRSDAQADGIV